MSLPYSLQALQIFSNIHTACQIFNIYALGSQPRSQQKFTELHGRKFTGQFTNPAPLLILADSDISVRLMRNWDTYNWQTATEWLTSQWQRWVTFVTLAQRRIQMDLCTCQYESVSVDLLVIWTTQTVTVNVDRTHPNQVYSKGIHYNIEIFHKSSELVLTTSYTYI